MMLHFSWGEWILNGIEGIEDYLLRGRRGRNLWFWSLLFLFTWLLFGHKTWWSDEGLQWSCYCSFDHSLINLIVVINLYKANPIFIGTKSFLIDVFGLVVLNNDHVSDSDLSPFRVFHHDATCRTPWWWWFCAISWGTAVASMNEKCTPSAHLSFFLWF